MRTEEEIREHVKALRVLMLKPCDCHTQGGSHEMACVVGGKMMKVAEQMLLWALGSDECSETVDKLNRAAEEFRTEVKRRQNYESN